MVEDPFHYGAIVKLSCTPNAGHEQGGWRPAIIVSNDIYNATNSTRMVCPITHTYKHDPCYLPVIGCDKTDGYIMCNQASALDLHARKAKYVEDAPRELVDDANTLVKECL